MLTTNRNYYECLNIICFSLVQKQTKKLFFLSKRHTLYPVILLISLIFLHHFHSCSSSSSLFWSAFFDLIGVTHVVVLFFVLTFILLLHIVFLSSSFFLNSPNKQFYIYLPTLAFILFSFFFFRYHL